MRRRRGQQSPRLCERAECLRRRPLGLSFLTVACKPCEGGSSRDVARLRGHRGTSGGNRKPNPRRCSPALPGRKAGGFPPARPTSAALPRCQTIELPLIVDEPDSVIRGISERYLEARGIVYDEAIEMWSIQALKCCVSMGMGFSILPEFVVRNDIEGGALVPLRWKPERSKASIFCARRSTHRITAAMELFSRATAQSLSR